MRKVIFLWLVLLTTTGSIAQNKNWKLVWADEFNYNGLPDSTKWSFETKGNSYGWGNNEKQFYTDKKLSNASVNNGVLQIIARKENIENRQYSSARLSSVNKAEFQYGKFEIRAKLPNGKGTWPAIWMLGKNITTTKWPECGEIDIMEHVGYDPGVVHGTIHTAAYNHMIGTQKGKTIKTKNPYDDFHTYELVWTKEKMEFFMDGMLYNTIINEHKSTKEWPFDQPFYMILNLAIGGDWGGKKGIDENIFPAVFEIDYVRVYKQAK